MKKFVFLVAVAAIAISASLTSVDAKPGGPGIGMIGGGGNNGGGGGGYPNKPGCCGGFTGNPHGWGGGWGGGISVGLVNTVGGGDCYYVRRRVLVPGIGVVIRRQLICE